MEDDIVFASASRLPYEAIKESEKQTKNHWPRDQRPKWLLALLLATGSLYTTRIVMPLCVVALAKDLSWDKRESGLILSSFFWGYLITQIPGGFLSDVYGAKKLLLWSVIGCAFSTIAVPVVSSSAFGIYLATPIILVVILRVCLGFAQGVFFPSIYSLLARSLPLSDRSSCSATALAGGPIGSLVMGSLGSVILDKLGWHWVFISFGFGGIVWALMWYKCFMDEDPKQLVVNGVNRQSHKVTNSSLNITESNPIVPWGKIMWEPAIWAVVIVHFCHNCMYFNLISWLPTYFHENFPEAQGWIFNVVPYVGNLAGKIVGGNIADRMIKLGFSVSFVRKLLETSGTGVASLFLLGTTYATEFWQALTCVTFALGLAGLTTSGSLCNIQDLSPGFAGSISGIVFSVGSIPGIFGVYMTGYILHITKSWRVVFQLTSVVCICGNIIYNILGRGNRVL